MKDLMNYLKDDTSVKEEIGNKYTWNIMIIDDEQSVHDATHYALRKFSFMNKGLKILDAYSAKEAEYMVAHEDDLALMLVDVVMETDDAGLRFIKWYRDSGINPCTRIILRTGQPGQAPEQEIILNYDLHDYKTKTELTAEKLFSAMISGLRGYNDIRRLEQTKDSLEKIVKSTSSIMRVQTMYEYAQAVLQQISNVFDIRSTGILCAHYSKNDGWSVLAESGKVEKDHDEVFDIFNNISHSGEQVEEGWLASLLYQSELNSYAVYLETNKPLNEMQARMILLFCHNVSIGLSNIKLYDGLIKANRFTVMSLAQITESRDHSTGEHVFRIAKAVEMLTSKLLEKNLYAEELADEELVSAIGLASTLHDIGKISIADKVLLKPGKLTDEEFEQIKLHTVYGADVLDAILNTSSEKISYLGVGKDIARYHHERWDGKGYPERLTGLEIPIPARITSIVDVFDALTHARCYKPPYELEEAKGIIADGIGTAFDPVIADLFLNEVADVIMEEERMEMN